MFCRHCGHEIPSSSVFCTHCGGKIAIRQDAPGKSVKAEGHPKFAGFFTKRNLLITIGCTVIALVVIVILLTRMNPATTGQQKNPAATILLEDCGPVAEADGQIFYSVSRDNGSGVWNHGIYSSNANGTTKLSSDRVTNLYAKNDWLYYYAQNGSAEEDFEDALRQSGFFIMRFDGSGRRKLGPASYNPDNWKFIQINKNTFYYINNSLIYRMDTNSEARAVSIEKSKCFRVINDNIYYLGDEGTGTLYRINIDGTKKATIYSWGKNAPSEFWVAGSWLVYVDAKDNCFHRIDLNGKQHKKLSNETAGFFRVANSKWLYFRKSSDGKETLFRLSINGGSPIQTAKNVEWPVRLDGDWLYYFEKDQDPINSVNFKGRLFRVRADGNDNKVFVMNDEPNYNSGASIDIAGEWIYYSKGIAFAEIPPHLYRVRKDGTQAELIK